MRRRMRICIVTHYWPPHVGGTENVASAQAIGLAERGHIVTVVTSRLPGDSADARTDGVRIRRVKAWNGFERRDIPFPVFGPSLFRHLRGEVAHCDVVLVHGHAFLPSMVATQVARRLARPVVLLQHTPQLEHPVGRRTAGRALDAIGARLVAAPASRHLAVSGHSADFLRRMIPSAKVEVLPNGVDTTRFRPASVEERVTTRSRLGWHPDHVVVLTVRRLVERMGLDVLIEASALLPAGAGARIVIAGEGPLRAGLDEQIRARGLADITLVGHVDASVLQSYYRAADLFVLPSRSGEGFGLTILEAFASGLPVIATRSGAPSELVDPGINGLLVPPGEASALSAAIMDLVGDSRARRRMGIEASRSLAGRTWSDNVDRLETVLATAVATTGSG